VLFSTGILPIERIHDQKCTINFKTPPLMTMIGSYHNLIINVIKNNAYNEPNVTNNKSFTRVVVSFCDKHVRIPHLRSP